MKFSLIISILFFASCTSEVKDNETKIKDEPSKLSPKEYAEEYCACLSENSQDLDKCNSILEEAAKTFGEDNKEAEAEFSKVMQNCLY